MPALRDHLGFWLRFVSNHVSYGFARKLSQADVTTAEWVILREMYDAPEHIPSELAERIGLTRGAVSRLLERLLQKGLATRREHAQDRRYQTVSLTSPGRKLVPVLARLADRNEQEFFAPLSVREHQVLTKILQKLASAHNLQTLPTE